MLDTSFHTDPSRGFLWEGFFTKLPFPVAQPVLGSTRQRLILVKRRMLSVFRTALIVGDGGYINDPSTYPTFRTAYRLYRASSTEAQSLIRFAYSLPAGTGWVNSFTLLHGRTSS